MSSPSPEDTIEIILMARSMAYHEMRLIVAKVLFAFDLELAPESRGWGNQEAHMLWQKPPLMCTLKAVN